MLKTKTLKVRVKDRHAKPLAAMARSVSFVWNCIHELSHRSIREPGVFLSGYDLQHYTKGAGTSMLQCPSNPKRVRVQQASLLTWDARKP